MDDTAESADSRGSAEPAESAASAADTGKARRRPILLAAAAAVVIAAGGLTLHATGQFRAAGAAPASLAPSPVVAFVAASPSPSPSPTPTLPPGTPVVTLPPDQRPASSWKLPPAPSGRASFYTRVPTEDKVIFIGIDDGTVRSEAALAIERKYRLPVTLFLTENVVAGHEDYFLAWQQAGARIENHTMSHPKLTSLGYSGQRYQFCQASWRYAQEFGRIPVLARPTYGEFNSTTRQAAASCGIRALVNWTVNANSGGKIVFQTGDHFEPGDIVIMHFRDTLAEDYQAVIDRALAEGFTIGALEDYLGGPRGASACPTTPAPTSAPAAATPTQGR